MIVTVVPICTGSSVTWPGGEASKGEEESLDLGMDVLRLGGSRIRLVSRGAGRGHGSP